MKWYLKVLKEYTNFEGRARRTEYWMFALFNFLIVGVMVRRLHDTDRSGWWYFISFVPLVGSLILLFFLVQDGTVGNNQFGENPKGVTEIV